MSFRKTLGGSRFFYAEDCYLVSYEGIHPEEITIPSPPSGITASQSSFVFSPIDQKWTKAGECLISGPLPLFLSL